MTRSSGLLARLAAAVLVTAAAGLAGVATAPPAAAATCSTGSGVSVVVDFGGGAGVQTGCVAGGAGKSASSLFESVGFKLDYVQNQPGFVCRINGLPSPSDEACVNTPPDNAYWALWWSDGTSGSWSYSNYGASSLKVPDGAYVGFAWQTGGKTPPGAPASPHPSTPTQSATPTPSSPSTGNGQGGHGGNGGNGGGHGGGHGGNGSGGHASASPSARPTPTSSPAASDIPSASQSGSPSAAPTKAGRGGKHRSPSATPAPASSAPTSPSPAAASPSVAPDARSEVAAASDSAALPVWVVPLVILVLGASASVAYVKRRRSRPSP